MHQLPIKPSPLLPSPVPRLLAAYGRAQPRTPSPLGRSSPSPSPAAPDPSTSTLGHPFLLAEHPLATPEPKCSTLQTLTHRPPCTPMAMAAPGHAHHPCCTQQHKSGPLSFSLHRALFSLSSRALFSHLQCPHCWQLTVEHSRAHPVSLVGALLLLLRQPWIRRLALWATLPSG